MLGKTVFTNSLSFSFVAEMGKYIRFSSTFYAVSQFSQKIELFAMEIVQKIKKRQPRRRKIFHFAKFAVCKC
jgi:hypothetical protein